MKPEFAAAGKMMIAAGLILAAAGCCVLFADKIPFLGRLPGDFNVKRDNFRFYFPLTSSILISVALSLVLWLISYLKK